VIGIIGGSGLYDIKGLVVRRKQKIRTPYGTPSDRYVLSDIADVPVVFLPRHGADHSIPPHRVNYRANIWGFRELGVQRIISFGATGGISRRMRPHCIVVPDQIIDMTAGRDSTFFDGDDGVVHIDFTEPYCGETREIIMRAAKKIKLKLIKTGTYICTAGPRLETKSEIQFYARAGADIVGMTAMPEAVLAREAEICYAAIAVVTNTAAGLTDRGLSAGEVIAGVRKVTGQLKGLVESVCRMAQRERTCACRHALKEARV
jgi:5'-methylthioadenosine phosphorylase